MREPKPLKYTKLDGISEKQLADHHDVLYVGYIKKLAEIEEKLKTADFSKANATYSEVRGLKREEPFATNGIYLHEYYFDNLGGGGGKPEGEVAEAITRDFGSLDAWLTEFLGTCMAARGWVVLAFNTNDGKLHNYLCDAHDQGGIWGAFPLLVFDAYEHAFFIDYGVKRKDYIDAFMKNIDWKEVEERYQKAKKII